MEKNILNTQVVKMRRYVKQAKVHIINKMSKEIRMLLVRKGDPKKVLKAKRKAERLLDEIVLIKRKNSDTVSKMALAKEKDWQDILNQKNSSLKDRCFALLASYKSVQREVENFHKSHSDLVPKIGSFLQEWEEKRKRLKENSKSIKASYICNREKERRKISKFLQFNHDRYLPQKIYGNENKTVEDVPSSDSVQMETESSVLPVQNESLLAKQDCNFVERKEVSDDDSDSNEKIMSLSHTRNMALNSAPKMDSKISVYSDSEEDFTNKILGHSVKSKKTKKKKNSVERCDNKEETEKNLCNSKIRDQNFKAEEPGKILVQTNVSSDADNEASDQEEFNNKILFQNINAKGTLKIVRETNITTNKISIETQDPVPEHNICKKLKIVKSSQTLLPSEFNAEMTKSTNYLKTVTMLNLDDLHGLDEIPITTTSTVEESVVEIKRRNDPFFLGGSEVFSEENSISSSNEGRKYGSVSKQDLNSEFSKRKNFSDSSSYSFKKHVKKERDERTNFHSLGKKDFKAKNRKNTFQRKSEYKRQRSNIFQSYQEKKLHPLGHDKIKNETNDSNAEKNRPKAPFFDAHKSDYTIQKKLHLMANNDEEKPLHPSWEAKRKLKQAVASNIKGKRVVFD